MRETDGKGQQPIRTQNNMHCKKISVQKSVKDEPLFNEGPLDTHLNKNDIANNIQECFIFLLKSAGI